MTHGRNDSRPKPRRAAESTAASLILNIAIRETLSSGDNISRKFRSRSGPTKCLFDGILDFYHIHLNLQALMGLRGCAGWSLPFSRGFREFTGVW